MAKDIEEKIGAMSQKNWHVLNYKNPLKNYRVHEMPTGDQLPPHYTCANPRATRAQTEPNATENQQLPPASPCGPHRRPPWRRPAHPLLARVR